MSQVDRNGQALQAGDGVNDLMFIQDVTVVHVPKGTAAEQSLGERFTVNLGPNYSK